MMSRVIPLVLVAIAISAAASAQERLPRAPGAGDQLFGMEPGKPAPVPLNRTFMRAPSNAGDGRPIDLLSGFAPAPAGGATGSE